MLPNHQSRPGFRVSALDGTESRKDTRIRSEFGELDYSDLINQDPPTYDCPYRRFAYLYKYGTCHANLVYERIRACQALRAALAGRHVTVSSIGGGPGSEYLGVLKYVGEQPKRPRLKFFLLDREAAWSETWSDVDDMVSTGLQRFDQLPYLRYHR